jgi:uncharacterized phage protein (TIGR02218 family)
MKSLSLNMLALLASDGIGALAEFWTLTRTDGVVFHFTNWSNDVALYKAAPGWSRSALQEREDLAVPNQEITGIVLDGFITASDIRGGKYQGATVDHFFAVPTDADFLTYGRIRMPCRYIGEMRMEDGVYILETRGISYLLQQNMIDLYGPICRADFADKNADNLCKLDPANFTITGTVATVSSAYQSGYNLFTFTAGSGTMLSNWKFGTVYWDTGKNAGYSMEISEVANHTDGSLNGTLDQIELFLGMPYAITVGDTFHAVAGCAKSLSACQAYNNVINLRAESWIHGTNFLFDYGTSS